jgi:hypothetical protein
MRKAGIYSVVAAAGLGATACSSDITVPNYNNPTTTGVAGDPSSLQLIANGIVFQTGVQAPAYIDDLGKFGREAFQYTPTEGRNTTNYFPVARLDRAGFAATYWFGRYNNIRNTFNLVNAAEAASITPAEKAAARGFAKTMEALELQYVIATRDTIGAPVEVRAELDFVAPFVSRDSVYRYISTRLDEGATDLAAGGTAFPFTVNLQFTGLGAITPTTFLRFNRAIAARVFAYRGSLGMNCGASSCYQQALTAANASFLGVVTPTSRATLDAGVYNIYATSTGATQNTLSRTTSAGALRYAHPSILRDTTGRDANGLLIYGTVNASRAADLRTQAKIITLAAPANPPAAIGPTSVSTPYGFSIYTTASSPIPIIRNEELLLIRAEAQIGLGNLAAALADINTIRTVSGGVAPLASLGTAQQAIDALLYERWLSLLYEGHRIIDHRRFNRLNRLPIDKIPTAANGVQHYIQSVLPVPQAECLARANTLELQPADCRI